VSVTIAMERQLPCLPAVTACLLLLTSAVMASDLLKEETIQRRKLSRFKVGDPDNAVCWQRHDVDGFYSPIDAHNHFRPFGGPPVPWHEYIGWMKSHGILFSTMLGIGQQLIPREEGASPCCYYLHCANYNYPVVPDPKNDIANAEDYKMFYKDKELEQEMHLTLSYTSANLQQPENNTFTLGDVQTKYPGDFKWAGEINVYKHALAANGFFENGDRVTEAFIKSKKLDPLFNQIEDLGWPITLHCDLGCDQYDHVPALFDCTVPESELALAKQNYRWWASFLGPFYKAFFDESTNEPRKNFRKIQHLKIWVTLLTRYPKMTVVWAHLGLSKELKNLHPSVHAYIINKLLENHKNLYLDVSWDVLSKQIMMNYKNADVELLHPKNHVDLDAELDKSLVDTEDIDSDRLELVKTWEIHREMVNRTGSVTGPTHAMAIYLEMFHANPDRFVTGTDFVSSKGPAADFPGTINGKGCMKDKANHARQLTDTSAINMFFNDEAFRKIVLGENYFKILGLEKQFQPPPVCGDSVLPVEAIIGIGVGAALLLVVLVVIVVVVLLGRRDKDDRASFIRVDSSGNAATTHV